MKLHYSLDGLHKIINPVVTTGSFDGVHVGHKAIINRLIKLARDINGETVLITFYPHPRRVLYPEAEGKDLRMILSQKEKIELLAKTGLDHLVILTFTKDFSRISSREFVETILVEKLRAKIIIVGFNHHFGHNRQGDFSYLYSLSRQFNFEVEEIPEQDIQNESVSSTKIRKALLAGNIQRANAYLDHNYLISGELSHHQGRSEILSLPTYSLIIDEDDKLVPPDGIYAVKLEIIDSQYKGLVSISDSENNHGLLSLPMKIEIHIIDAVFNRNDMQAKIYFFKKIRELSSEDHIHETRKKLKKDQAVIKELIY